MSTIDTLAPKWNDIPSARLSSDVALSNMTHAIVNTDAGPITVSLSEMGARLQFGRCEFGDYGILKHQPELASLTIERCEDSTRISGAGHTLVMFHEPFSFRLYKGARLVQQTPTDGHFVRKHRLPPFARTDEGWFISLELGSNESVYGLGEKWGRLDKRGQLIRSFNHDALGVNAEISYKNTPFAWSPEGWGVFVHTPAPVTHGVGFAQWSQRAYGLLVEDSHADLFLLTADTGAELIADYTRLTGRAPLPPEWSLGLILSKAYYQTSDELLEVARAVRANQMPCDTITLDGRTWQDTDTRFAFEWDPIRYPDPSLVIDELKALKFKVCVWEYPLVSVKNPLFQEMSDKGWLIKHRGTGETYRYQWDTSPFGKVLTPLPESGIVDFTHPEAFAFWRDSHKALFDLGIDMIKADFGEQIEPEMIAHNGDTGHRLHNVYSLLYNRCVYEAAELYCHSGAFLFTRASWTGSQCYPAQWGGDPQADWGGLAGSLRGGLAAGMSGFPYYATDIGGFYADQRDAELYVRWAQAAVFSAHIRLHGIGPREPWSYGKEAEQAVNKSIALRYRLLPYLLHVMTTSSQNGMPAQRAMVLAAPCERAAWGFDDQFMLGDDMLVAPCVAAGGMVECYLPSTISKEWVRFPSGERFQGGQSHHLKVPIDEIAVFVPAGKSIPLGPAIECTEELPNGISVEDYWQGE
jgi:alpha-D-xyloside xylohydrolase